MNKIQVEVKEGIYICDIGISKEEWKAILQNKKITNDLRKEMLLRFYREPEHKGTCSDLHEKHKVRFNEFNARNTQYCIAIQKYLNRFEIIGLDEKPSFWNVTMLGRRLANGNFEYQLRPELVSAIEEVYIELNDYQRFKKLLEYFVAHLEYASRNTLADPDQNTNTIGYDQYIKPAKIDKSFVFSGFGYKGQNIQNLIARWCNYSDYQICININAQNYRSYSCYLNWKDESYNIVACWKDEQIDSLQYVYQNLDANSKIIGNKILSEELSIQELGLFDGLQPNEKLKWFYVNFYKEVYNDRYLELLSKLSLEKMKEKIQLLQQLLENKKNIILQGAPGTGKTYSTAALAVAMCDGIDNLPDTDEKIMMRYEELSLKKRIGFCTFHQSMDYEDFVEGLKPIVINEGIVYKTENGIFKQMAIDAQTNPELDIIDCIDQYLQVIKQVPQIIPTKTGKSQIRIWYKDGNETISTRSINSKSLKDEDHSPSPLNIEKVKLQALGEGTENNWPSYADAFITAVKKYFHYDDNSNTTPFVLIIDEINRGNISKVFGELITLLETDKRIGSKHKIEVTLPYSKESFSVPSNLYIIGTMNTTDRSTGTIDYAIRRRFAFYTLEASREVIKSQGGEMDNVAIKLFEDIENFIYKHKQPDEDIKDLMIGHSYFFANSQDELMRKMKYEIIPLIKEYIKDGILFCRPEDYEKYFTAWLSLEPYIETSSKESTEN